MKSRTFRHLDNKLVTEFKDWVDKLKERRVELINELNEINEVLSPLSSTETQRVKALPKAARTIKRHGKPGISNGLSDLIREQLKTRGALRIANIRSNINTSKGASFTAKQVANSMVSLRRHGFVKNENGFYLLTDKT